MQLMTIKEFASLLTQQGWEHVKSHIADGDDDEARQAWLVVESNRGDVMIRYTEHFDYDVAINGAHAGADTEAPHTALVITGVVITDDSQRASDQVILAQLPAAFTDVEELRTIPF